MKHKKRTLAATVEQVTAVFSVLLLTGPRQVGKTTLLEDCSLSDRSDVNLLNKEASSRNTGGAVENNS